MATLLISHPVVPGARHRPVSSRAARPVARRAGGARRAAVRRAAPRRGPRRLDGGADARPSAGLCRGHPRHPPGPGEHVQVDGDTVMSQGSAEAAQRAAGAVVAGVEAVMEGKVADRLRGGPPARSPRGAVHSRRLLPLQQHRHRCTARADKVRRGEGRDRRFRRPSRPGNAGRGRARSAACSMPRPTSIRSIRAPARERNRRRPQRRQRAVGSPAPAAPSSGPRGADRMLPALDGSRPSS